MSKEIKSKEADKYAKEVYKEYVGKGDPKVDILVLQKIADCERDFIAGWEAHDQFTPSNVEEAAKEYCATQWIHHDYLFQGEPPVEVKRTLKDFKAGASYQSSISSPVCARYKEALEKIRGVSNEGIYVVAAFNQMRQLATEALK